MERWLFSGAPESAFEEHNIATGAQYTAFACADADGEWCEEAGFEFDGGQPEAELRESSEGNADVEHGHRKAALDVAEVIPEGWLFLEAEEHAAGGEIGFKQLKRR